MIILDGNRVKKEILDSLRDKVNMLETKPNFAIIEVGDNPASLVYLKQKEKMANYLGYGFNLIKYEETTEEEIIDKIHELNNDNTIHGIMVQLPLPKELDKYRIINEIDPRKDIDGLTQENWKKLISGKKGLLSPTALGIMKLLETYNISIANKDVLIVGKSLMIGKPLEVMMSSDLAHVTVCDSKTTFLEDYTETADIIISGVGKPNLITRDMIKFGVTIIDAGINQVDGKLCGDVDYENVADKTNYITPVPGGVGPMTIAMLASNILAAYMDQVRGE